MRIAAKTYWARFLAGLLAVAGCSVLPGARAVAAEPRPDLEPPALVRTLAAMRPDYGRYISSVRPLTPGVARRLYMALVRPGATDPAGAGSAPYAGPGARNDIVYDELLVASGHSLAWRALLLDHEYFHARHMAGATLLPVTRGDKPQVEKHYNEAAAWGFNVAEARSGRYPGLRAEEFREALDRQGEHYAALRDLLEDTQPGRWSTMSTLLRRPDAFLKPGAGSTSRAAHLP